MLKQVSWPIFTAKELGAPDVICRAENVNHARVERIGADMVVRPEHDLAKRLIFQQLNPRR